MFVRNGESLGSVRTAAAPKASPEPDPVPKADQESTPPPTPPAESTERPKDYDNKPEWVEYAVSKGAGRDEAEGLTKPELIELYGGEE